MSVVKESLTTASEMYSGLTLERVRELEKELQPI